MWVFCGQPIASTRLDEGGEEKVVVVAHQHLRPDPEARSLAALPEGCEKDRLVGQSEEAKIHSRELLQAMRW